MICFDTSVLVDYLRGEDYVEHLLDGTDEQVGVPRLARYELYVGAERSDDPTETPDRPSSRYGDRHETLHRPADTTTARREPAGGRVDACSGKR